MSRQITLTIAVPEGSRYMTTDRYGCVDFWARRPEPYSNVWRECGRISDPLGSYHTNIPCEAWRESLIELPAEDHAITEAT